VVTPAITRCEVHAGWESVAVGANLPSAASQRTGAASPACPVPAPSSKRSPARGSVTAYRTDIPRAPARGLVKLQGDGRTYLHVVGHLVDREHRGGDRVRALRRRQPDATLRGAATHGEHGAKKRSLFTIRMASPSPESLGLRLQVLYMVWYSMVWCPSYPLDNNRCDQVVAAGSGAG
jgi:hypothetical protein